MTDNQATAVTKTPVKRERRVNKAERMPRDKAKRPSNELVGQVKDIEIDLQASDAASAVNITIAPKTGGVQKLSFEAMGEVRQTAIALLIAAKMAGKKVTITLGGEGATRVARSIAVVSKKKD